ncbi:class I SAM-dependent methyltransferase [Methanolapillus ohkumae]
MSSDNDGIRFATPEPVARYRAARLKCGNIADISCGIGGQTIYFAMQCRHVYAVEIDPVKLEYARENCKKHNLTNVTFICGDALDPEVIRQIPPVDIVFSDPARPPEEETRKMTGLCPQIPDVMTAYAQKCQNFAFEAPPQMPPERILADGLDCEMEYLSLNGQLNRLTLYFGNIKRHKRVAVSLPSGNAMVDAPVDLPPIVETNKLMLFAYEPDPSIVAAGLLNELTDDLIKITGPVRLIHVDKKRILLTSDLLTIHPMVKNNYIALRTMPAKTNEDLEKIREFLEKSNVGKVVIRGNVDPKEYWNFRNSLESGLFGTKKVHLYLNGENAMICELIYDE